MFKFLEYSRTKLSSSTATVLELGYILEGAHQALGALQDVEGMSNDVEAEAFEQVDDAFQYIRQKMLDKQDEDEKAGVAIMLKQAQRNLDKWKSALGL